MMATKKSTPKPKTTDLVADDKQKALLAAIATGDVSSIDTGELAKLVEQLGLGLVAKGIAGEVYKRVEHQRKWFTATDLDEDELQLFKEAPEVIGKGIRILSKEEAYSPSQDEIDFLVKEEMLRRGLTDIVGEKGVYQPIRATFLNLATFESPTSDPNAEATFTSPANQVKVIISKTELGGDPNYALLEKAVTPEVWEAITDPIVTRVVNEEKLVEAIGDGIEVTRKVTDANGKVVKDENNKAVTETVVYRVTTDQFKAATSEMKVSRRMNVYPLKENDPIVPRPSNPS